MIDREPDWIGLDLAHAIHARQLSEHGGTPGVRDEGMLESALSRPRQLLAYGGESVDMLALAAAYAFGIARNHPFVDGNKRTAYVVCRTFLVLNGWDIAGSLADRYRVVMDMAAGEIDEADFAEWLRGTARPNRVNEPAGRYETAG